MVRKMVEAFHERSIELIVEDSTASHAGITGGVPLDEVADRSELLVVLGGDGTILWTLKQLGEKIKPIAAVNTGTLGFLTCAMDDDYLTVVDAITANDITLSSRTILRAEVIDGKGDPVSDPVFGLNEVCVSRAADSRVVHVEVHVDGGFINHYTGDGLIIATPTGSTAYNLSAGGPILEPLSEVFAITPICPHALANRAVVVGSDRVVELHLPSQRDELLFSVDGQLISQIDQEFRIRVMRAHFDLALVQLPGASFYDVLHQKLGWFGSTVAKL